MSTDTDRRVDEARDRTDRLQASAQHIAGKARRLESNLKTIDHAVAAEIAEYRQAFADDSRAHREGSVPQ